jgi:hypothetical protein
VTGAGTLVAGRGGTGGVIVAPATPRAVPAVVILRPGNPGVPSDKVLFKEETTRQAREKRGAA